MWLYDTLVWTVLGCGAELERKEGSRRSVRKVYKMDDEIRLEHSGIYDKGRSG